MSISSRLKVGIFGPNHTDYLFDVVADGFLRLLDRKQIFLDGFCVSSKYRYLYPLVSEHVNSFPVEECDLLIWSKRRDGLVTNKPTAIIDGDDDVYIRHDYLDVCSFYYLREYLVGASHHPKVKPLHFAAIPHRLDTYTRDLKVYGNLAGGYNSVRDAVFCLLTGYNISSERVSINEYRENLQRSLLGLSIRGCGEDALRYWEVPYTGALLLTERTNLAYQNNFTEEEAIFWTSIDELKEAIESILAQPTKLEQMAIAGQKKSHAYHLSVHRAEQILRDFDF